MPYYPPPSTPGGTVNIKQTEIDFGEDVTYVEEQTFTITDADVSLTSQMLATLSLDAPTGRDQDDVRIESFDIKCSAGTGQFELEMLSLCGPVHGKFKVNYLIG